MIGTPDQSVASAVPGRMDTGARSKCQACRRETWRASNLPAIAGILSTSTTRSRRGAQLGGHPCLGQASRVEADAAPVLTFSPDRLPLLSPRGSEVSESWWLDEVGHAGAEHLDAEYVAAYDEKSPTDWSEDIDRLSALGVGSTSTVVDLGAGTGTFALAVRPHVARVVAVDVSSAMVELMRSRGIEAVEAGFLTYEHSGAAADLVHTRNALHHLPDFWKAVALDRMARILRPGGVLILEDIVYAFDPSKAATVIEPWLANAPTDPARGWTAEHLAEHVRTEYSTFSWLLESLLDHAGFDVAGHWISESCMYASYTCRLRDRASDGSR
jgi:SAM-dependent methyltransferase